MLLSTSFNGEVDGLTQATVDFLEASALDIQSSSTTTTVTIPASVMPGDFMVLHVVHRSSLTGPSGWTLLEGPTTPVVANQMQSVYYRVAVSGDESDVVVSTQSSADRMLSHIQIFRPSAGTVSIVDSAIDQDEAAGLDLPALSATGPGQIACVSMGNAFAVTSGVETITPPSGYTQTTPETVEQNRLACAYKTLTNSEQISGRFENVSDDTDRTAFSLILGAG